MPEQRIILAPGASGTIERLAPHRSLLGARGFQVDLLPLPKGSVERALPVYRAALGDAASPTVIGGHSFGGRVASLLAAEVTPAALVLLSYPLHAPGRHDAWEARTSHWPAVGCPVLLLSGESDPFARLDLLQAAVGRFRDARLVTYPRVGHGLGPVLDEAMTEAASFIGSRT